MAVERLRTCDDVNELAQELGVTRRCLYKWRVKLETIEPGEDASRPSTHTSSYRKQIHQLKRRNPGTDGTFISNFELFLTLFPLPFRRKMVPVPQNTVDKLAII